MPQQALKQRAGGGTREAPSGCDLISPPALPRQNPTVGSRRDSSQRGRARGGTQVWCVMASSARETSRPNDPPWLDSGNSFNPEMVRPPAARHSHGGRQGDPAGGW